MRNSDSSVRGHVGVPSPDCALDLGERGASRVEGARKLGEEIIPRRIDHPAPMLADQAGDVLAVDLKIPHGRDLVFGQEAAVADRIGDENGGQSVNDGVRVQRAVLAMSHPSERGETPTASVGGSHGDIVSASPPVGQSACPCGPSAGTIF